MKEYRVSKKYALKMTGLFVLFTAASIWIGFEAGDFSVSPSIWFILLAFGGFYITKLANDDSGGKGLQIALTLAGLFGSVLLIVLLGGLGVAIIGVLLFGFLGGYYIWINLIKAQPVIKANEDELILFNSLFKGDYWQISWSEIESLAIREQNTFGGNQMKYLTVKLKNPDEFKQKYASKTLDKVMAMNEKMYGAQLAVQASNLEVNENSLIIELRELASLA